MSDETVLLTYDGPVAVVSMNRPDRHNAFTDAMDTRFFDVLQELYERPDVRCVVWRGAGKSFSSNGWLRGSQPGRTHESPAIY